MAIQCFSLVTHHGGSGSTHASAVSLKIFESLLELAKREKKGLGL